MDTHAACMYVGATYIVTSGAFDLVNMDLADVLRLKPIPENSQWPRHIPLYRVEIATPWGTHAFGCEGQWTIAQLKEIVVKVTSPYLCYSVYFC